MPIRVFMLITDLKTGGVPLHVHRLASSLDRSEFEVRVACLSPPGEVSGMLEKAGVPTLACGAEGAWDVAALWHLVRLLRRHSPDVLHAFLFHANTAASLVGPLAGLPVRRMIHEIQTVEIERRWHLTIGGLLCRMCRCVVGNSQAVVEHLHRGAHIPVSRLRLIPGGVDLGRFSKATALSRASLRVPESARLLMWVGRLDPIKGLDELVDAVALLRDPSVHLVLVGEGEYESAIRRRINASGLSGHIRFAGRRDDVPNLLAAADVFVFPSRTEGMPNALLEAMAVGLPIVTTDVPGCRDLIVDGRTGLLAPPGRPDELADRIRRLLSDSGLAGALSRAARLSAEKHAWEACVQRYAALYRAVAGKSPCAGFRRSDGSGHWSPRLTHD